MIVGTEYMTVIRMTEAEVDRITDALRKMRDGDKMSDADTDALDDFQNELS